MPTPTLDELTNPLTRAEVEQSVYGVLASIGVDTTSWKPGAVFRASITAACVVMAAFSRLQAAIARSGFLELASGDWLTLVARYVYGVEREGATFATGAVTLTNAGGGIYEFDIDDVVFLNPTTGKTYKNKEAISLGASTSVTIAIEAEEAGAASTSAPSEISGTATNAFVGGAVTIANQFAVVGNDAQEDPVLRTLCLEKLGALSPNGPWDAYSYVAKTAKRADGSLVGVTRVRNTKDGYGNLTTYVATATGVLSGDDLLVVDNAIQRLSAPLCVTAETLNASIVIVAITYELWIYNTTGKSNTQILTDVAAQLTSFMSTQPIGGNSVGGVAPGKVYQDAIRTAIGATYSGAPRPIFHVVVSLPASDTTLTIGQVPVVGTITGTINQVAPQAGF